MRTEGNEVNRTAEAAISPLWKQNLSFPQEGDRFARTSLAVTC